MMDFGGREHTRITSTRSETAASIRRHNLHRKFDVGHPILKDFSKYLQSSRGNLTPANTANEKCSIVSRYLYWCNPTTLDTLHATNGEKVTDYIDEYRIKTTAQASTIRNYCQALHDFSEYVSHKKLTRIDSKRRIERTIRKIKRSLRTALRRRKSHNRSMLNQQNLPQLAEIKKLQKLDAQVRGLIRSGSGLERGERNTVTSYIITRLALKNAARASHVCNLSMRDFNKGVITGTVYQVKCTYSKSKDIQPIVSFDQHDLKLTKEYISKLRPHISDSSLDSPLFPSNSGGQLKNFSTKRHLYKIMEACGIPLFNLTSWRKAVTTEASRTHSQDTRKLRLINQYLCHTEAVALAYYTETARPRESLESFRSLQKLFK